ncbi:MAG: hypothetical protein O0V67_01625 [Methanocorpusculum sp.]|nr:hypothetical protein [Methanocorpusculum sp.]
MTQAITQITQSLTQPDDIYLRLRKTLNHVRELDLQIKNLKEERDQLMRSCQDMALTIEHDAIDSPRFILRGCKTIRRRTIDVQALREKYPEIYAAANPYVDEKIICEILLTARPGWNLQGMAEELRPDLYHANTKLKIGDVENAAGKRGMLQLEDAGIVKVNVYVSGEPDVISREIAEAKPRAELREEVEL